MKKVAIVMGITTLVILGILYYGISKPPSAPSVGKLSFSKSASPASSLVAQAKKHPGLQKAQLSSDEQTSECKSALESIETLPFQSLVYDLRNGTLKLDPKCLFLKTKPFENLKGFPQVCDKLENGALSKDCLSKLLYYKAHRVHYGTREVDLKSLPTEVIIQKLIAIFAEGDFQTDHGARHLQEIGREVYERLPWSEPAARVAMIGYFVAPNKSAEDDALFETLLRESREKFPESWDLFEMELTRKKLRKDNSFKDDVQKFYDQYPEMALAKYHMGCLYWADGQASEARSMFQQAATSSPKDQRFAETLKNSLSLSPPQQVCSIHIAVKPDDF